MFALEIEYLTGRAVATARHERGEAEWPPHPGRLFSALVAACHEADLTTAQRDAGRAALLWLEALPPPALAVSPAATRDLVSVYVPVNDTTTPMPKKGGRFSPAQVKDGIMVLPERRDRKERHFPSVTPERPTVHFLWREADDKGVAQHREALQTLAARLTYLGHSSSLVRALACDVTPEPSFEPAAGGALVLRVPVQGRIDELERAYERQSRPSPGAFQGYCEVRTVAQRAAESVFGEMIVCRLSGPAFPLPATLRLMNAVRDAMISHSNEARTDVRELVSGHTQDGKPTELDHAAYIPLANVGWHHHADGSIKGFAVVLPRGLGRFSIERREILRALIDIEEVRFGAQGPWRVEIAAAAEGLKALSVGPYVGPSALWASVTPVLCDRFPKAQPGQRIEDVIASACRRVLKLEPVRVQVSPVSWFRGVPASHHFGRIRKPGDAPRHRTHVLVEFDRRVRGPIVLGAGRYHGLGLLRAWKEA
jgi:CRISPR-associated protein Csb2